jgi:hypothetical protein
MPMRIGLSLAAMQARSVPMLPQTSPPRQSASEPQAK